MSNILNHNKLPFNVNLDLSEYWDFSLYLRQAGGFPMYSRLHEGCLAAYIDTKFDECILDNGSLKSLESYSYSECKSNGIDLNNIGFTGMDNGFIRFDKYTITLDEFTELLTKSAYHIPESDCTLKLHKVDGNNGIFNYSNTIVDDDGVRCARLNGGFFQGFFMDGNGCNYKVIPNRVGSSGWSLEFELKHKDFYNSERTLNSIHPENNGIFFYMGTRAENKWVKYYDSECEAEKSEIQPPYHSVGYVHETECTEDFDQCLYSDYYPPKYIAETDCGCQNYFKGEYLANDSGSGEDAKVDETNDGHMLNEANLTEIETDNKFVLFDRSCKGLTVKTYQEGDTALIQYRTIPNEENFFPIFNRSCNGITVNDYGKYFEEHANIYNIYDDLYRNAFALQVREDGAVGYKYIVKDCDAEDSRCSYAIKSEFTNPNEVKYDEWANVHVRIISLKGGEAMRIMIYVNGLLKLVSVELPMFDFRKLSDTPDKQEGVPFNISIGGGTQGLADVIYNDYTKIPEYVYPLEKEFGGSFIGYIKSFKFYECSLNATELRENLR